MRVVVGKTKCFLIGGIVIFLIWIIYSSVEFIPSKLREKNRIHSFSIPIISTTKTNTSILTKKGYGLVCGEKLYYPFHLDGQAMIFGNNKNSKIEKEKINGESDMVIALWNKELLGSDFYSDEEEYLLQKFPITRKFSMVELNEKKLTGNFFSVRGKFQKGDSGRGIFDIQGNCVGMLIGFLEGSGEGVFVEVE